ncbi:MAG: recombination mediator RecR [Pseudomonadota bacterium]
MSYQGPKVFRDAVAELSRLPGIGEKTAQRLVMHLVQAEGKRVEGLAESLKKLTSELSLCSICFGYTDVDPCPICNDPSRDAGLICVVEDPSDLFAIERSAQYRGVYHVLHGTLAPLDGIGPQDLKIDALLKRVAGNPPREVVLATNPDVEGDATALYLAKLLSERKIRASRIAMGIPMGGHLEYTDQVTLGRAILERREFGIR